MGSSSSHPKVSDANRIRKKLSLPILMALKRGATLRASSDAASAEVDTNIAAATDIAFTVDLIEAAALQIGFLHTVNLFPRLYGKENKSLFGVVAVRQHNTYEPDTSLDERELLHSINLSSSSDLRELAQSFSSPKGPLPYIFAADLIKRCLWRYETLWLPLCARFSDKKLVPPLDVDWAWHCHSLCPRAYQTDCLAVVKRTIGRPVFSCADERIMARERTMKLWAKATSEPFHILGCNTKELEEKIPGDTLKSMEAFRTKVSYDIRASMERQASFIHQISFSYVADREYLQAALRRYKQFLYLMKKNRSKFIVPTYDIDMMWHAHQMYPIAYAKDTTAVVGGLVNHDDSVNDRTPKGKLDTSANETDKLWRQTFGAPQLRAYGGYRGEPNAPSVALNILVAASKRTPEIQKLMPSSLYDENTQPTAFFYGKQKAHLKMMEANAKDFGLKATDSFRVMIHIGKATGLIDNSTSELHYTITILSHTKSKLQLVRGKPVDGKECEFNTRHMVVCNPDEDYGLSFNLYRKRRVRFAGHKLIGSCSIPFENLRKSVDLHSAGRLQLVDSKDADAGELQVSLSLTPPESENIIMSIGVPSKNKSTEEGVLVHEEFVLKTMRLDRSFHDLHGKRIFQVHEVNMCVMDDENPPPSWACFSLDSTEALQNVDDVHSIPPVATAQSCYNKYHLEVPGIAALPLVAQSKSKIIRRKQTMYIERGLTRLLLELRVEVSEDSDGYSFFLDLTDVSTPKKGREYHLFAGRRYGFAGTGGPGRPYDDCVWTLVCYHLTTEASYTLNRDPSETAVAAAAPASNSFLDRVDHRLDKQAIASASTSVKQTFSQHALSASTPFVGIRTSYAAATIDVRGVLEANPGMDMAVVVAVAQSISHLITQNEYVHKLLRDRFTSESSELEKKSSEYDMDYHGAYFGGCGAWYVGTGALFYLNTSHHGFGNVAMPSVPDNDVGYEGAGACDLVSGCGGDWTGHAGGTDLGIAMGGEFELGLDGVDLDMSTLNLEGLDLGDNFDVSGLLDSIFH